MHRVAISHFFDARKERQLLLVFRLRSRMGLLKGVARVNGQKVVEGTMTFALGDPVSKS